MSTISTEQRLQAYLDAEAAILKSQETRGGDRSLRMAELAEVRAQIDKLQTQLARERRGGRVRVKLASFPGECR